MKTDQKLIVAAAALLDSGGEEAVTLRAVAQAVGVSHNAPYKHFEDRSALMAAVATRDFMMLTRRFAAIRRLRLPAMPMLKKVLAFFVAYSQKYPARYRLLFSTPNIWPLDRELHAAALGPFVELAAIVERCQNAKLLPSVPTAKLASLIYASVHGLIDVKAGGRMRQEKGLARVEDGVALLLDLLTRAAG